MRRRGRWLLFAVVDDSAPTFLRTYVRVMASAVIAGDAPFSALPTCGHCRVLLDEAWEHPVEVAP